MSDPPYLPGVWVTRGLPVCGIHAATRNAGYLPQVEQAFPQRGSLELVGANGYPNCGLYFCPSKDRCPGNEEDYCKDDRLVNEIDDE